MAFQLPPLDEMDGEGAGCGRFLRRPTGLRPVVVRVDIFLINLAGVFNLEPLRYTISKLQ